MSATPHLLDTPEPRGHFVQFYDGDALPLARNVARYLSEGLIRGEAAIVIVTPEHLKALITELSLLAVDVNRAVRESRLLLLDAANTLREFMVGGQPDRALFEKTMRDAIGRLSTSGSVGLRAYGEMVGILWAGGNRQAAVRLEELWNELLETGGFTLFCSYPIDIFGRDFEISGVDSLLCGHTHLIPTGTEHSLEAALHRALDELLGSEAAGMKLLMKANYRPSWAMLPAAEAMILWLRNNLPRRADAILEVARGYYRESEYPAA